MGKSPAYTESTSMSKSPITKLGTQTPVMVTAAKVASLSAFRRAAATTPAGMAMRTDTTVADKASCSDTGTRSRRSRATFRSEGRLAERVPSRRRHHAGRDGDEDRHHGSGQGQLQRHRHAIEEVSRDLQIGRSPR